MSQLCPLATVALLLLIAATKGNRDVNNGGMLATKDSTMMPVAVSMDLKFLVKLLLASLKCTEVTGGITIVLFHVLGFDRLMPALSAAIGTDVIPLIGFNAFLVWIFVDALRHQCTWPCAMSTRPGSGPRTTCSEQDESAILASVDRNVTVRVYKPKRFSAASASTS